jgi:hypothetical protein
MIYFSIKNTMHQVHGSVDQNAGRSTEDTTMEGLVWKLELGLTAGSEHESSSRWGSRRRGWHKETDGELALGGEAVRRASSGEGTQWWEDLHGEASLGMDGAVLWQNHLQN